MNQNGGTLWKSWGLAVFVYIAVANVFVFVFPVKVPSSKPDMIFLGAVLRNQNDENSLERKKTDFSWLEKIPSGASEWFPGAQKPSDQLRLEGSSKNVIIPAGFLENEQEGQENGDFPLKKMNPYKPLSIE